MPTNGAAAVALVEPASPTPTKESELALGEAVASAMATLYAAVQYAQAGELDTRN